MSATLKPGKSAIRAPYVPASMVTHSTTLKDHSLYCTLMSIHHNESEAPFCNVARNERIKLSIAAFRFCNVLQNEGPLAS